MINKKLNLNLYFSTLFLFILFGCKDSNDAVQPKNTGENIVSFEKGEYVVYAITKINFLVSGKKDTNQFYIKEQVSDTLNLGNENVTKLIRYKKDKITDKTWAIDSVWYMYKSKNQLVKVENNVKFVKLIYPVQSNQKWNGNVLNNLDAQNYQTRNFGSKYLISNEIKDTVFTNSLTVIQNDSLPINLLNRNYSVEIFADNMGLIYKEYQIYTYDQSAIGSFKISTGTRYIQKYLSYGKE